jgi:hypothetical protein
MTFRSADLKQFLFVNLLNGFEQNVCPAQTSGSPACNIPAPRIG